MKAIIFSAGFVIGLALGFFPGIEKPKPWWWRLSVTGILSLMIFLALFPHTAGTFRDAVIVGRMDSTKSVPVLVQHLLSGGSVRMVDGKQHVTVLGENGREITIITTPEDGKTVGRMMPLILDLRRGGADNVFICERIVAVFPGITLPYIIGLEERARILYFHVPMSWIATLAYIIAMIYGIKYLRNRDLTNDIRSSSAAALGTVFCLLATATGSIWAKFNWGSFWNWDPRETSIFLLLLVYAAYFVLRASVEGEHQRAKLSSAYSIIACVTVPFFIFIAPRLYEGLHPGSSGDVNAGPVISPQPDALNLLKQIILSLSFAGFTALFFWLLWLTVRIRRMETARESAEAEANAL